VEPSNLQAVTRWGKVHAWWLMHPGVQADHFCVLAALATYADEEGFCEPSQKTLARWLQRSRPWVNRVIAELEELGVLIKTARTRGNGGTTSCRYQLLSRPPKDARQANVEPADVTPLTRPVTPRDTLRQPADTTHLDSEHIQTLAPDAPASEASQTTPEKRQASQAAPESLPVDWQPSTSAVARAQALYPGNDLTEHTALFVARCRGKGYAVHLRNADEIWLSWLIEDCRRAPRKTSQGEPSKAFTERGKSPHLPSRHTQEARYDRFAAWGLAASSSDAVPDARN